MTLNMRSFKKKTFAAVLFWFISSFHFISSEIRHIKMSQIKFVEKRVPKSSLALAKEFQSPSFSSLTCAISTGVLGKRVFLFNEEDQSCKIFDIQVKLSLLEESNGLEGNIAVKVDG